jgi:transposase
VLGLASRARVFVYAQPTDMRKSFFTLAELVTRAMHQDPLSGDAFVFVNRRRTMAKCLVYDGTGMCLTIKRLSKGRFASPWERADESTLSLSASELALFFERSPLVFVGALSPQRIGLTSVVGVADHAGGRADHQAA